MDFPNAKPRPFGTSAKKTKPHITAGSSGGVAGLMGFTLGISLHRFRMLLGLALGEPRRLQRSLPRGGRHGLEL